MSAQQALILVVDDNPTNIKVLFDVLEHSNFRVLVAKSGESALEKLKVITPDLILLDVMMPEIDGFEVCRQLKEKEATRNIPIIFMTALSDEANKVRGFDLGAVDYITKPFHQEEVLARVRLHLNVCLLNQELEQKVAELTDALTQLKRSQLQLVQSEKMSSLGQLVGGIAHEINNPVNFIHANLSPMQEYVRDLLNLVQLYQTFYPNPIAEIQTEVKRIDLKFIQEDLPNMLGSMQVGTERIQQIVLSLRNFSRTDEAEYKAVNIHEGIDNTLLILQHRLEQTPERPAIQVIKHYDNLPLVECCPGQLNQVFLAILTNAIDALDTVEAKPTNREIKDTPRQITIRTAAISSEWVEIAIGDNGMGMSEDIQQQIFDPFFTTKPIGKGTGMGMSISYQIVVEQHGGKLECFSELGKGAEFVIQIPRQQ